MDDNAHIYETQKLCLGENALLILLLLAKPISNMPRMDFLLLR